MAVRPHGVPRFVCARGSGYCQGFAPFDSKPIVLSRASRSRAAHTHCVQRTRWSDYLQRDDRDVLTRGREATLHFVFPLFPSDRKYSRSRKRVSRARYRSAGTEKRECAMSEREEWPRALSSHNAENRATLVRCLICMVFVAFSPTPYGYRSKASASAILAAFAPAFGAFRF